MEITKKMIKEHGITDFMDGPGCDCGGCMLGREILSNQGIVEDIKAILLPDTGQTNYITKWDLEQIMKKHGSV